MPRRIQPTIGTKHAAEQDEDLCSHLLIPQRGPLHGDTKSQRYNIIMQMTAISAAIKIGSGLLEGPTGSRGIS